MQLLGRFVIVSATVAGLVSACSGSVSPGAGDTTAGRLDVSAQSDAAAQIDAQSNVGAPASVDAPASANTTPDSNAPASPDAQADLPPNSDPTAPGRCAIPGCPDGATADAAPVDSGAPGHPDSGTAACVSDRGGHCGGNIAHPCTCVAPLVCTPGAGGLPFGDVGGTCESAQLGAPEGGASDASPEASCTISASDYDQSCTVDSDCTAVAVGDACQTGSPHCWCPGAAISVSARAQYDSDVAKFNPKNVCDCIALFSPCCVSGKCHADSSCHTL